MDVDDWGTLLTVLLIGNLIVTIVAAALIAKHHKETTLRGSTTHRDNPYPGTPGTTVRP